MFVFLIFPSVTQNLKRLLASLTSPVPNRDSEDLCLQKGTNTSEMGNSKSKVKLTF